MFIHLSDPVAVIFIVGLVFWGAFLFRRRLRLGLNGKKLDVETDTDQEQEKVDR